MSRHEYKMLAHHIVECMEDYDWSVQGFGMLRFYITQDIRVHVWDSAFRVSGVSDVHTHPWHFHSTVLSGRVRQYRFTENKEMLGFLYDRYLLKCGEEGCLDSKPVTVRLKRGPEEVVEAGGYYQQRAEEIHASYPEDGTITLVHRQLADPEDPDHAFIYVPEGGKWVDAIPRPATANEVAGARTRIVRGWSL